MEYSKPSILKTLIYSDIFDFPLRRDELWEFLVSDLPISKDEFEKALEQLLITGQILYKDGYYSLRNRQKIIEKRQKNLPEVDKKLSIAKRAAYFLSYIPTIKFIGISGGLAMYDVDVDDDIDFFVIAREKTIFITRLWILAFLEILKLRRKRQDKNPANKICVNFIIDETKLKFPREKHDIYIAHEIVQIKPLFERDNIYNKFFKKNQWVKKFFPNAIPMSSEYIVETYSGIANVIKFISFFLTTAPVSGFVEWSQVRYIARHKTIENVSGGILAFHPKDYRSQTLEKMSLKLQELGLLTKI